MCKIVGGVTVIFLPVGLEIYFIFFKILRFIHTPLFFFVSCMKQLYMEALLIHWHTSLKFSSEILNIHF